MCRGSVGRAVATAWCGREAGVGTVAGAEGQLGRLQMCRRRLKVPSQVIVMAPVLPRNRVRLVQSRGHARRHAEMACTAPQPPFHAQDLEPQRARSPRRDWFGSVPRTPRTLRPLRFIHFALGDFVLRDGVAGLVESHGDERTWPNAKAQRSGPPARMLKLGKSRRRPRSASAVGYPCGPRAKGMRGPALDFVTNA